MPLVEIMQRFRWLSKNGVIFLFFEIKWLTWDLPGKAFWAYSEAYQMKRELVVDLQPFSLLRITIDYPSLIAQRKSIQTFTLQF